MKRVFVFFLCFVMVFNYSFSKYEKEAQAVVLADDAIVSLIVIGTCIAVGTYSKTSDHNSTEMFVDMFGENTLENLRRYIGAISQAEEKSYLKTINNANIEAVASSVKKRYKHPVQYSGQGYLIVDDTGQALFTESIPYSSGKYYFVDDIQEYISVGASVQDVSSGNYKLSKDEINKLISAVGTLTKPYVIIGKNILGKFADIVTAVSAAGVYSDASILDSFGASYGRYSDTTALICNFGNDYYKSPCVFSAAFEGVFLELHYAGDVYFGTMSSDRLSELNDSYSNSSSISVFTNNLSKNSFNIYSVYGSRESTESTIYHKADYFSKLYCESNMNYIDFYVKSSGGSVNFYGQSAVAFNTKGDFSISRDNITIVNNGLTGNYVIGNVNADGSISYTTFGETTETSYIDGLDTSTVTRKVTGDVNVNSQIIESVAAGTATLDEVNDEVDEINSTVKSIDSTVSSGFSGILGILTTIKDLIFGIPDKIANAFASFFTTLWRWLSDILSAVISISAPIVSAINSVVSPIVTAIEAIPSAIASITIFQTIIRGIDSIVSAINNIVLSIPDTIISAVEAIKEAVISIPSVIVDILDHIKDLPEAIGAAIIDALVYLFVPNPNFFNDWKDNLNSYLVIKLPYDTYLDFINNIKDIAAYRLSDITVVMYGKTCTVVSFGWYYDNISTINDWVRGVMFFILVFFNLNQMYKLIRGTSLYKVERYAEKLED